MSADTVFSLSPSFELLLFVLFTHLLCSFTLPGKLNGCMLAEMEP